MSAGVHGLHEIQRAEDVAGGIVDRIEDAASDVDLRGQVAHHIEFAVAYQLGGLRRGDVAAHEAGAWGEILFAATREVIEYGHLPTFGAEPIRHMRADEARATRH